MSKAFALTMYCLLTIPVVFCQQPIAHWPFNNHTNDASGNNNNGLIKGNLTNATDRFGNPCGAYHFDGVSAYIEVPGSPSLDNVSAAFSITVWFKLDQTKEYQWLTAICKGSGGNELPNNPHYRLQVQQNSYVGVNTCSPYTPSTSSTISINTDFTECDMNFQSHLFEANKWTFYALVYDGQKVITYMNGKRIFEYPFAGTLVKNNSSLYIGYDQPGNAEFFEGSLDDIRLFNQALNDQQIINIYKEANTANSTREEFEMTAPGNVVANIPENDSVIRVHFDPPPLTHSGCAQVTLKQIEGLAPGSNFRPGRHRITYEAVSSSGYEERASFYVIVKDITPPVLTVPADTTLYINRGETGIKYVYNRPKARDNYRIKSVTGSTSIDFFPKGTHTLKYRATDAFDNYTDKQFVITVKERDTIPLQPPLPTPTPKTDIDLNRPKNIQKVIEVENDTLKARLYDNAVADGDTVSLILNNTLLISKHEVAYKELQIKIVIDSTRDNELVMYAHNLGRIPPNTARLVLYDGDKEYEISMRSTLNNSGTLTLRRKKKK